MAAVGDRAFIHALRSVGTFAELRALLNDKAIRPFLSRKVTEVFGATAARADRTVPAPRAVRTPAKRRYRRRNARLTPDVKTAMIEAVRKALPTDRADAVPVSDLIKRAKNEGIRTKWLVLKADKRLADVKMIGARASAKYWLPRG